MAPCVPLFVAALASTTSVRVLRIPTPQRRALAPRLAADDADPAPAPEPFRQAGVPENMQPTVEMAELRREPFFDWAELKDQSQYIRRLANVYALVVVFLGLPIALTSYTDIPAELPQALLGANLCGLVFLFVFLLRLRAGWAYVSERLSNAETYYEVGRGGGARGYVATKDAEEKMRDRLLLQYEVQPVTRRLDTTLAPVGAALVASLVLLFVLGGDSGVDDSLGLRSDSEAAAREQRRAQERGPKPAYCSDRFYRARAGGSACD